MAKGISDRQIKFIDHYLVHLNASRAAMEAGYSPKTAFRMGQENLQKPAIRSRIDEALAKRSEKTKISSDQVLEELAIIAFSDVKNFINYNGQDITLKQFSEIPEPLTRCISKITQKSTRDGPSVTIQMHDKLAAIEKLEKHLPMHIARLREVEALKLEFEQKLLEYKQKIGFTETTPTAINIQVIDSRSPDYERNTIQTIDASVVGLPDPE